MYSIYVFLKNGSNIELFLGSATSLSFIYQPAKLLELNLIYEFNEERDLNSVDDFSEFIEQIRQIVDFWKEKNNYINHNRPDSDFINRLLCFHNGIKNLSLYEISSISIF